jgi:hypothetical protein
VIRTSVSSANNIQINFYWCANFLEYWEDFEQYRFDSVVRVSMGFAKSNLIPDFFFTIGCELSDRPMGQTSN